MLSSLEGERGEPRLKPPFPAIKGLYGQPTIVNNVETLCTLPFIVRNGAEAYAAIGTEKSKGTKLVSVSGHVKKTRELRNSAGDADHRPDRKICRRHPRRLFHNL